VNDFIPSEKFVAKTMEAISAYEASKARPSGIFILGIVPALLQAGALLASCGIALANVMRLYYAVFAPVLSH
jgi:hypothetical protein